jgi:homoserine O-succinyltransferase/O-acetyltransferase
MSLIIRHREAIAPGTVSTGVAGERLRIALINNMSDPALEATERQFATCLSNAGSGRQVELTIYSLPAIRRGPQGERYNQTRCHDFRALFDESCDAVIITGAEPQAADLADEPYWWNLTELFDWAAEATGAIFLSCLSAHAWLQHRDGIIRRRLSEKRCGLYAHGLVSGCDDFTRGLPDRVVLPHSRWHDVEPGTLAKAGYRGVYADGEAGGGIFLKRDRALVLLAQGHPEYDARSLVKEYRRDVARYLRAESDNYPMIPQGLFGNETRHCLTQFQTEAKADRTPDRVGLIPFLSPELAPDMRWDGHAADLFSRWLAFAGRPRAQAALHRVNPVQPQNWAIR